MNFMTIQTRITELFGLKYPIISAPMGPFYTKDLAIAVSEAGGLGVLSHTNLEGKDSLKEMENNMLEVVEHTDKPFGFNIRTSRMQPDAPTLVRKIPEFIMNNPKVKEQCVYALTSAGSPRMLAESKGWGKLKASGSQIKLFHVAPALWLAEKCVAANVDGIVATGTEGGGHQSYEKVSTLVLLQQVQKEYPDLLKVACGGFATGEGVAAGLALGADAVAMGTRFIASAESEFHPNYKAIVPEMESTDTDLYTGVFGPIRLWNNPYAKTHQLVENKEAKMAQEAEMDVQALLEDQRHYELTYHGDTENGAVLLGQSGGIIDSVESVPDILENITKAAEAAIQRMAGLLQ
jgi:NAD(P)H-dependent flavin oxidoreductase YrpB (nitropropane dioxygenase family)